MWNVGLDEAQTGINVDRRNINNLRYADDITLVAEIEEELKNLLMKLKEENEETGLKVNILAVGWDPTPVRTVVAREGHI